jgi:hypothetical protein
MEQKMLSRSNRRRLALEVSGRKELRVAENGWWRRREIRWARSREKGEGSEEKEVEKNEDIRRSPLVRDED